MKIYKTKRYKQAQSEQEPMSHSQFAHEVQRQANRNSFEKMRVKPEFSNVSAYQVRIKPPHIFLGIGNELMPEAEKYVDIASFYPNDISGAINLITNTMKEVGADPDYSERAKKSDEYAKNFYDSSKPRLQ